MNRALVSAVAIGAVATAACVGRTAPTPDPFDAWSRTPLPADEAFARSALQLEACRAGAPLGVDVNVILQDRRTTATAAFLLAGGPWSGSCLSSVGGNAAGSGRESQPDALIEPVIVDERNVGVVGVRSATLLGGRALDGVARVEVRLDDGTTIEASVGAGHWLAWWPGETGVVGIDAVDGAGTVVATLADSTPLWQRK